MINYLSLTLFVISFIFLLKNSGVDLKRSWFAPLFAVYFGLVGAALFGAFLNGSDSEISEGRYSAFELVLRAFWAPNYGNKVMYGAYFAIIGLLVANFIAGRKQKLLPRLFDIFAISISLLFAVWRIGCAHYGCCYGRPTGGAFGVICRRRRVIKELLKRSPDLIVDGATVPLFPTQLISSLYNFAIFFFLFYLFYKKRTRYPYFYFFAQLFLYGFCRFIIEFFRFDPREIWGFFSMSQWISLVCMLLAAIFFIKNRKEIGESFEKSKKQC